MKKSISNWGNYPVIQSNEQSFSLVSELEEKLSKSEEVIARGMGRCYGDASLAKNVFSTLKFNHLLGFDSSTGYIELEAGITLKSILDFVVPQGNSCL